MCVQDVDVQCVLQFTLVHAAGCALHRRVSRVIHRIELYLLPREESRLGQARGGNGPCRSARNQGGPLRGGETASRLQLVYGTVRGGHTGVQVASAGGDPGRRGQSQWADGDGLFERRRPREGTRLATYPTAETAGSRPGKTPEGGRAARTATHTREVIDWALVDARAGGGGHHQPQRSSRLSARPPPEGRRIR